jgi:anti-anti-sigma factor
MFEEEAGRGLVLIESAVDAVVFNAKGNCAMLTRARTTERDATLVASEKAAEEAALVDKEAATEPEGGPGHIEERGGIVILEFTDNRLAEHNAREAREVVDHAIERGSRVVFDMRRIGYVSSIIIGLLASANKRCAAAGGRLVLAGLQPIVQDVLESVKLDKIIAICADTDEAVALLEG